MTRSLSRVAALAVAVPLLAQALAAQSQPGQTAPTSRSLRAVRVEDEQVQLDGVLNEGVWQTPVAANGFTQRDPDDGSPATEQTEVRIAYSQSAVYVAVRALDSDPAGIRSVLGRRDVNAGSDIVAILLDTYDDRRTAFRFAVTPRGSIRDVVHTNDMDGGDASWDPVWDVATSVDAGGWNAEFRIPLSQLRFDAAKTAWGLQVYRRIERKAEDVWWAPYSKDGNGFASRFGRVDGLDGLPSPKRLEVRPYIVANGLFQPAGTGSSYAPSRSRDYDMGLDLKFGLTSNLTLDLTANPDFGQVEADPSVVNLSAFETFLPERRTFFVEGAGLLPQGILFYSRRIGRPPQGSASAPTGGTVQMPGEATILAAAKVTGKQGGLGIGVMSALTGNEDATLRDPAGNVIGGQTVEPLTHYFAGRVSKDLQQGDHALGVSATAVNRDIGENAASFPNLRSAAYAGALDGNHRWRDGMYTLSWTLGGSHIRGSTTAITAAQRSSIRYFQRPDAEHLEVDPTRTSLSGWVGVVDWGKQAGTWRHYLGWSRTSSGFEANDMGFHGAVDHAEMHGGFSYVRNTPLGRFRNFNVATDFNGWRTTGGETERLWLRPVIFNGTTRNNWFIGINPIAVQWSQFMPNELRGGPGLRNDTWHNSFVNIGTDGRKRVSLFVGANLGGVFGQDTRFWGINPSLSLRPSQELTASIGVGFNGSRNEQQWVNRRAVGDSTHYVMASIDQKTVNVTTRVDWTLSPRLSLQFYGSPFVSAGTYDEYKGVRDPQAGDFAQRFTPYTDRASCTATTCSVDLDRNGSADFSFPQPNFTVKELNSTAIVRWEYRPGSVLYVGWQHGRSDFNQLGTFQPGSDLQDLFSIPSRNTLLLKLNYWLSF